MSGFRWASRTRSGASASRSSAPTRSTRERWQQPGIRTRSSCTACPRSTTRRPRSARRCSRHSGSPRWKSPRRSSSRRRRSCSTRRRTGCTRSRRSSSPPWPEVAPVRIVVALGGNALLQRGQPMTADQQRANVRVAATQLAPIAEGNELVISHGNGPQVGLLALQAAAYTAVDPYPLDVLGAQTEGMIGYMIEQELGNLLPFERPFATILTMVEVDPNDPAFSNPTKFIGPVYERAEAETLAAEKGWAIKQDGQKWRRVVASPEPKRIFEIRPITWLLEKGAVVVCTGGGGIPTMYERGTRRLVGAEVVIDKDRASALLAEQLNADLFVMATDVDAVYSGFGTPEQAPIRRTTPADVEHMNLPAGSMGPKVEAAAAFVEKTGKRAAIGTLAELRDVVAGDKGTQVVAESAAEPAAAAT